MTESTDRRRRDATRQGRTAALVLALAAAVGGCGTAPAPRAHPGPALAPAATGSPVVTTTDFSAGLRCMDHLLLVFGAREVSLAVEDAADGPAREQAPARDLLLAAVSDMSQRSRSIRLVAGGRTGAGTPAPTYTLRSSATVLAGTPAGAGYVRLALGLSVLRSADQSVLPGTASRTEALLRTQGSDRRADLHKLGRSFAVATGADAQADAWRALAQLAAIEAVGRLQRLPYWTCLGVPADATVSAEMQDWYDTMAARPPELIGYFQSQLRQRQVYDGPADGAVNAGFRDAVSRYRATLGLSAEPKLSLDFFTTYLAADHAQLAAALPRPAPVAATAGIAAATPAAPAARADATLSLRVAAAGAAPALKRGEALQLSIRPSRPSHVYCFLQDEQRRISRFFPNRFQPDARVAESGVQLPGPMRFEIVLNARGAVETVSCFATDRDVLPELPPALTAGDFEPLAVASLDQLRSAFVKASGGALAHDTYQLRAR